MGGKDSAEMEDFEPEAIKKAVAAKEAPAPKAIDILREQRLQNKENRIASKMQPPPPPKPKEVPIELPPPMPSVEEKSAMIDKIQAYREKFPTLKKRNTVSAKSSFEDLADEIHYIEMQLGSKEAGDMSAHLLQTVLVCIEQGTKKFNPLNLKLDGLAAVGVENVSQFQPLLDELYIKYGTNLYIGVEWRLALALGALIMTVNAANQGNTSMKATIEKMNSNVEDKAKDL